jgi:hypothetical protein
MKWSVSQTSEHHIWWYVIGSQTRQTYLWSCETFNCRNNMIYWPSLVSILMGSQRQWIWSFPGYRNARETIMTQQSDFRYVNWIFTFEVQCHVECYWNCVFLLKIKYFPCFQRSMDYSTHWIVTKWCRKQQDNKLDRYSDFSFVHCSRSLKYSFNLIWWNISQLGICVMLIHLTEDGVYSYRTGFVLCVARNHVSFHCSSNVIQHTIIVLDMTGWRNVVLFHMVDYLLCQTIS